MKKEDLEHLITISDIPLIEKQEIRDYIYELELDLLNMCKTLTSDIFEVHTRKSGLFEGLYCNECKNIAGENHENNCTIGLAYQKAISIIKQSPIKQEGNT